MKSLLTPVFKDLPDQELIRYCRHGNDRAFNELFRRYFNKLHQFSLRYLKDGALAESLVLDLLFQVWQRCDRITGEGSIAPYLFTAMKNRILNHVRKKYRETVSLDEIPEMKLTAGPVDEDLAARELSDVYRSALEQLSPQRKKVFKMSREQGMTHKEIAETLRLSVNTVENHISASMRFLRRNLEQHTDVALMLAFLFCA